MWSVRRGKVPEIIAENAKKKAVCNTADVKCKISAESEGSNIVNAESEWGNVEALDGSDGRS